MIALLCLAGVAAPASADSRWIVRGQGMALISSDSVSVPAALQPGVPATLSLADGDAFALGLEYLVRPKIGIELVGAFGNLDTDFRAGSVTASDSIPVEIFMLGVVYHFTPERRADVYAGAFFAQSNFDDVTLSTAVGPEIFRFDDTQGIGLKLGVDVPFKKASRWAFNAEVRYLSNSLEGEIDGQGDFDLHLLIPAVGISLRF